MTQTQTEPCPKCQQPRLVGTEHLACISDPSIPIVTMDHDGTMHATSGQDLTALLNAILGEGPIAIRREQFDWEEPKTGTTITFDITRMLADLAHGKLKHLKAVAATDAPLGG